MDARVLIISYHFYPDHAVGAKRMSELARELVAAGCRVTVLTVAKNGQQDPALLTRVDGVEIIGVPQPPKLLRKVLPYLRRQRNAESAVASAESAQHPVAAETESRIERLKRWYHSLEWLVDDNKAWAWRTWRRAVMLGLERPFDCVISSGPPHSAHLAARWAKPWLRAPWIMDLRDPWTDDSEWRAHVHSRASRWINRRFESNALCKADQVIATTPGLAARLQLRFPRKQEAIDTVYNGYDEAVQALPPSPRGELRLLYAGSLYYNRDPFPLLSAVAKLVDDPAVDRRKVRFSLVGNCSDWQGRPLVPWIEEHGLADCIGVRPPVSPDAVGKLLAEANVLVNFAQGQPRQIPAKMFEYIAAGREMLLLTERESDSARLALTAKAGRVVEPGDVDELVRTLRDLYRFYVEQAQVYQAEAAEVALFSREQQNARLIQLIDTYRARSLAPEAQS
ncbi:hypothetical protein CAI21_19890 [Alkalilimnicola ehrlichii]|uniref:Glycosyltransferase subfamily 4-like N-terminal domain-containing protein n=1 Tax=Alkalilimnicola ehrlichii TaxID=351052 RepID=A0A3E0WGL8_9GAMM|nr:glycosyltransferase family 4 protein [Alkalilimnicola ehrlichii]RFA25158.1 hypothetical protein CAI21_19890 [Alkalilimnicola ehrlichii]RFA32112.1 hypothetical protein CAL65_20470 [Alkalilimnicola ehrlichii]